MGYQANDEMDDSNETQLADELNSVKNNAMNFNTEEQGDTPITRVSTSTSATNSIELSNTTIPPIISNNKSNAIDVMSDSVKSDNNNQHNPSDQSVPTTLKSVPNTMPVHDNSLPSMTIPKAATSLPDQISTKTETELTLNASSVKSTGFTNQQPPSSFSLPPLHSCDTVHTVPTALNNITSTTQEGNDRVTLDQPPNVALVSHTRTTPEVVVADKTATVAANATESSNLSTTPPNTEIDAGKTLSTEHHLPPHSSSERHSATTSSSITTTVVSKTLTPNTVTVVNRPTSASISYSTSDERVSPTIPQTAQQVAEEEAIAALRAPLVNLYGSYLCHSTDTSLEDARKRLRNAITQTRRLRQTFTERVYGKYRVCLRPPPTADEIIAKIKADPVNQLRQLKEEIANVREEKEIEKKEAAKLNNEMSQSSSADRVPVLSNIDNAEQLMFLTAGLNLVILPEDQSEEQLRAYTEAYNQSCTTGRSRSSISQAAATAGEVILDRTRKAAAMRVERQRRRQLQLLRGEVMADGESESNYSRLQVLKIAGSSSKQPAADTSIKNQSSATNLAGEKQSQASSRRAPTANSRGGRSRSQSSLPTSTLLSINPSADEVKIDGNPSAATLGLIARGVGQTMTKSTQQRLRHPHPESLGGRRRANMNPAPVKKDDDTTPPHPPEPFLQSNLANTLPPLPASKERLERKRVADDFLDNPATRKARRSVQCILNNFVDNSETPSIKPVAKINLLNNIRRQSLDSSDNNLSEASTDSTLNLTLTMSVLYALGIVTRAQPCTTDNTMYNVPNLNIENKALCSDKLLSLKGKIVSSSSTLTQSLDRHDEQPVPVELSRKRTRSANNDTAKQKQNHSSAACNNDNIVDENICSIESTDAVQVAPSLVDSVTAKSPSNPAILATTDMIRPKKRQRSSSSPTPTRPSNFGPPISSDQYLPQQIATTATMNFTANASMLPTQTHFAQSNAMNMFQFANQLRHMHHPAAGDLAEYLGSFQPHQHGYDPRLLGGTVTSPLSVFGLMQPIPNFPGYTIQDRAAAARAMLIREQHAATILGGYQVSHPPLPPFSQLQANPFTMGQSVPSLIVQPEVQAQTTSREDSSISETQDSNHMTKPIDISNNSVTETAPDDTKNEPINSETDLEFETEPKSNMKISDSTSAGGLQFIVPTCPPSLPLKHRERILAALFHEIAEEVDACECSAAIDYLLSVGSAIPIPKALILVPLKERLNTPGFKNASGNNTPLIRRDIVASAILMWLWATQEQTFQQAFRTNGRIDVDIDCKWLIQAAVDTAVSELSLEIAESMAKGKGKFAEATALRKANFASSNDPSDPEMLEATKKLDTCTAAIVCKALSTEMCINAQMNYVIPMSSLLIDFLDEARLGALRVKSQERTLLATMIARNTFLSENLAHAYASAMVRAGEALKHGRLFEISQDEAVMASTMIPYDIFTDDTGAWEDPCKPDDGFTVGLSGEELTRRAHARAMIQKSLRKLQDRHHIRGGTTTYGPFVDSETASSRTNSSTSKERPSLIPQRSGIKRRVSSMMEPPIVPGTGSASAKSWAVYHPRHLSVPLQWDPDDVGNLPYGLNQQSRFLSLSNRRSDQDSGGSKGSVGAPIPNDSADQYLHRSTSEINWVDVASIFQSVEVPRKSSRYKVIEPETHVTIDGTIFAPFYEEINVDLTTDEDESDDESNDVEDLSDAAVLARHQVVLDSMKAKLEAYLEARKKQQERRKNKYSK